MNLMDLMIRIGVEDAASSGISSIVDKTTSAVNGIGNAIKTAVGVTTAAATAVGGYATAVGSAFEAQMSKVEAISGATADQMEQLTKKAKQMGIDTKFSATEAGQAFEYMAMAGWKTEQMLSGIAGVMDLSAASGENLARVSDIVTDALTAFGLAAEDSAHFSDVLAAASSNSNTNVSLMGETFKYVAPVAGALGFTIEDTATAIGTLANAGIKGSTAGTQLRQMFSRLSEATVENKKYFQELNAEMGDAADTMSLVRKVAMLSGDGVTELEATLGLLGLTASNADGSMRSLNDILTDLKEAMRNLTQEEQAFAAKTIAGQEAMSGLLAIVNSSEEEYNKLADAISNADGESKRMADTMINNLSGSFTMLKSSAEGFGLAVYEHIKGPLTGIINLATESLNKITAAFSDGGVLGVFRMFADELGKISPNVATSFIGTIGDAVERIGNLAGLNVASAVDNIRAIGETVQTVQEAFMEDGLDVGLSAFIEKFTGLTGVDISGFVSGLQSFISLAMSATPEILNGVAEGVHGILSPFQTPDGQAAISAIGAAVGEFITLILSSDFDWIKSVGVGIGQLLSPFVAVLPPIIENIKSSVGTFLSMVTGTDNITLAHIVDSVTSMLSPFTSSLASIILDVSAGLDEILKWAEDSGFADVLRSIANSTMDLLGTFATDTADLVSSAGDALSIVFSLFGKDLGQNMTVISNALSNIVGTISSLSSLLVGGSADLIGGITGMYEAFQAGDLEAFVEAGEDAWNSITDRATDTVIQGAALATGKTKEQLESEAKSFDIDPSKKSNIEMFFDKNMNILPTLPGTQGMVDDTITKKMRELGQMSGQGFAEGFATSASNQETQKQLSQALNFYEKYVKEENEINSPSRRYARIGRFMAQGIAVGWKEAMYGVGRDISESMNFGTGNISFADSASGKSSTGMINSLIAAEDGGQALNVNVYLDGELVARNQYGYLRNIAKQKGEPVNA